MTVYVDDMYLHTMGRFGRMKMSHMIADTEAELHTMADKIGVARKWFQGDHYDIAISKRTLAIEAGAVPITLRQCAAMSRRQRITGSLGTPDDADDWATRDYERRLQEREAKGQQPVQIAGSGVGHD